MAKLYVHTLFYLVKYSTGRKQAKKKGKTPNGDYYNDLLFDVNPYKTLKNVHTKTVLLKYVHVPYQPLQPLNVVISTCTYCKKLFVRNSVFLA